MQDLIAAARFWRRDRTAANRSALDQAIREARAAGWTYDAIRARTGLASDTILRATRR